MTLAEDAALADIRGYAAANRIQIYAAREATYGAASGTRFQELRSILINAPACSALPSERWRVHGVDVDGDMLEVILVIQDGLVIITLFG